MVQNPVWFQQNLKKEKKKERRKKEKAPGETCDRYFLLSEKVLLSLLSSSRLLTLSRFTLGFPSVSAEAAAQMQAAILYSATSSHTELARETPEVWRCAFQNKMITDAHKR